MKIRHFLIGSALLLLTVAAGMLVHEVASAETTAARRHVYNGHLLNAAGSPITTAHKIRFSYWTSADYVAGDVTATGAIHAAAGTYARWYEVFTVTPDARGYFSVQLGSGTALPTIDSQTTYELTNLYLQVEVKESAAADTTYELLDSNGDDTTIDRSPVLSVPSALNADMIDRRDVGTGSGSIPFLQSGGLLPISTTPGGTNRNYFTLDADNTFTATGSVGLRFGTTLNKTLSFDLQAGRFNFNDDVHIQGNLTLDGLVNGIDLNALTSSTNTHLRVSSGAGLSVNIAGGGYRINGNTVNYGGASNQALTNNATNYAFLTSTGLTIRIHGFPTNISYIPLAEVVTLGGAITSVTDRRTLSSDDREKTVEQFFHATYPNVSYQADGSDNVGQLIVTNNSGSLKNHYTWTSTRTSLQDYDINVRATVSSDFVRWKDNPLAITYASSIADTAKNQLDIAVFDTAGNSVTLSGSTTDLAATSWTTTSMEFTNGTWTPGGAFLIRLHVQAKDAEQMKVSDLKLQFVELHVE